MPYSNGDRVVKAYVASPLGFTEPTRCYNRLFLETLLTIGLDVFNPWDVATPEEIAYVLAASEVIERRARYEVLRHRIGSSNKEGIRRAEIVIANLDGPDVDAGVASEIGFANGIGRPCFGLRTDWRNSGELSGDVALQVEFFIWDSGGFMVCGELHQFMLELDTALDPIRKLARPGEIA